MACIGHKQKMINTKNTASLTFSYVSYVTVDFLLCCR